MVKLDTGLQVRTLTFHQSHHGKCRNHDRHESHVIHHIREHSCKIIKEISQGNFLVYEWGRKSFALLGQHSQGRLSLQPIRIKQI